jgi:hypothetical protein
MMSASNPPARTELPYVTARSFHRDSNHVRSDPHLDNFDLFNRDIDPKLALRAFAEQLAGS